jgi:AcrR family transcriptional regulator
VTTEPGPGTRTRILEAARRLFHEQGYGATGISTILREADANAGSLYHFFPSKEALLAGVLEHYKSLLGPVVTGPVEQATEAPVARVFALLAFYRSELERTGCRLGCPIGNLALEVSEQVPAVRPLVEENFAAWAGTVERWLTCPAAPLPRGEDRAALARFVLTVMEGAVMQARASASLRPFDESVAQLRAHFRLLEDSCARPVRRTGGTGAKRRARGGRGSRDLRGGGKRRRR